VFEFRGRYNKLVIENPGFDSNQLTLKRFKQSKTGKNSRKAVIKRVAVNNYAMMNCSISRRPLYLNTKYIINQKNLPKFYLILLAQTFYLVLVFDHNTTGKN